MHYKVYFKHDWMNQIWERKVPFFLVFMAILFVTYGFLYAVDFYPELTVSTTTPNVATNQTATATTTPKPEVVKPAVTQNVEALPIKLIIDKLDREVKILNPKDTSIAALDTALLSGIVRHPDSADFKNTGTMFLLGHSSYLPTVHNKNFQALNGIQKLEWGDTVRIQSSDTEYVYRIQKVYEVKASAASADIAWGKSTLVMVTCDSFGSKDDRFVVEAYLVSSNKI